MEAEIRDRLESFKQYQPIPWDRIPDIGLYMDQVITFITRVYEPLYGDAAKACLSSSMINNYVKAKLIPRPEKKKYNREQIALLTMIVALKQVSTMEDIRVMLTVEEGASVEQLYTLFSQQHAKVVSSLLALAETQDSDLPPAMSYAILASGYRAGCEAILNMNAKPNE